MPETTLAARRREPRVPRMHPLLFGTILFLSSELMFFGGLFAAYFTLRSQTDPWPPSGVSLDVLEPALATAVLVLSSLTMQAAIGALRKGNQAAMGRLIVVTLALGVIFLASQLRGYVTDGFGVSSNAYGTVFYAMTGFHGLHVLAGLLLMLIVLGRAAQGAYAGGGHAGAEAVGYYWHFVDAVWLALFATIFLIQ